MSKVKLFPWPKEWKNPRRALGFFVVAFGILGINLFLRIFWEAFVITGDYSKLQTPLLFLPSFLCFVLIGWGLMRRRRRTVRSFRSLRCTKPGETPEPGLVLKYSEAPQRCLVIFPICFIVFCIGMLCDPERRAGKVLFVPNTIAFSVTICALISLLVWFRGLSFKGTLILTSWGIYDKRTLYGVSFPWSVVREIGPGGGNPSKIWVFNSVSNSNEVTFVRYSEKREPIVAKTLPDVVFFPTGLEIDPVLALYLLRFYWIEITARAELGTPAALERLRCGDLTTQREYPLFGHS